MTVNGGKYSDPVFRFIPRPGKQIFLKTQPEAIGWPTALVQPSGNLTVTQTIRVQIAGVELNTGVINRNVIAQQVTGTQANITIDWK